MRFRSRISLLAIALGCLSYTIIGRAEDKAADKPAVNKERVDELTERIKAMPDEAVNYRLRAFEYAQGHAWDKAAADYLGQYLSERPSLAGILRLIELSARIPGQPADRLLDQLRQQVASLLADSRLYQCHRCGFLAHTHHWQCPGCQGWGSITQRISFDTAPPRPKE